ncbi:TRAP transporter small permease [Brevibacillus humidisoli]|uniref:TRAP transporter small permease n=1 Tax=Brevibacillus humidisoli TaxID=2895522 RepID=UPI001E41E4C5|nr:TRAP transporter small permease [Brevibacillus humidisoli]UFJ40295.1 TRAP transporter small permease [Brevibacillus humidisoli]
MLKKWLVLLDDVLSVVSLTGIILLTIVNVFCRFVLNSPIAWAEEVTLGLFVWLVFVGISSTMKRDGHIGIDYFVRKLPKPLSAVSQMLRAGVIYYVLIGILLVLGYELMAQAGEKVTPVLGISYQLIDLAVPFGAILSTVHFTRRLIETGPWKRSKEGSC